MEDLRGVGVENVRAVRVDEYTGVVVAVVGIAADVRPAVDHQHLAAELAGKALGQHGAGETGADDEVVESGQRSGPFGRAL